MKRNSKQNGSGGRLRLGLLLATVAAFLLVPAAHALAVEAHIEIEGNGSGEVLGTGETPGEPPIACAYTSPGPETGTCDTEAQTAGPFQAVKVEHKAAAGSEFAGWYIIEGTHNSTFCKEATASAGTCSGISAGGNIVIKAVFVLEPNVHIEIEGNGSGTVKSQSGNAGGSPSLNCAWDGEAEIQSGICDNVNGEAFSQKLIGVEQEADPGSEFVEWIVVKGTEGGADCQPGETQCTVFFFAESEVIIKAVFAALPTFALNLTTSGEGSGSFECDSGSGFGVCQSSYLAGTEVEVIANEDTGSEFVEFSGDCSGSSCELTMDAEKSVDAQFDLEQVPFTTEVEGEGTVLCNGEPCAVSYAYGTVVGVTATPAAENVLSSLTGSGSLEGTCNKETETCTETAIIEPSGVKAVFAGAKTVAQQVENVHGEVPETTELATSCGNDVDLGIFTPGVENRYWYVCNLTVTSTGEESELRAKDETGVGAEGHLTQIAGKTYNLPEPLEMTAESTIPLNGVPNGGLEPLDAGGVTLMSYPTPVSVDSVDAEFSQWIRTHDPLHTGVYSKEITLTLEQTEP